MWAETGLEVKRKSKTLGAISEVSMLPLEKQLAIRAWAKIPDLQDTKLGKKLISGFGFKLSLIRDKYCGEAYMPDKRFKPKTGN